MQLKKYDEKLVKSRGALIYNEYLKLINSGELLVGIEIVLDKLKMNLNKFISILMQYLDEIKTHSDYEDVFNELLTNPNPKEYLKENYIPKEFLSSNLNNFLYYKRPDILFGNKTLLRTLNSLIDYNNKLWTERERIEKNKKDILPFVETIIKDYLNQDYSLERFCLFRNLSKNYFNPNFGFYARILAAYNKELYQEFACKYFNEEQTKAEKIAIDIENIIAIIKENKEFDAIDFYQSTLYAPFELLEVANKILNYEDNKLIREYVNKLKNINIPNNPNNILKIQLLKDKYTLNLNGTLIETTEEERLIVLDFLEKENIPITSIIVFEDACKKYYKNELISKVRRKI